MKHERPRRIPIDSFALTPWDKNGFSEPVPGLYLDLTVDVDLKGRGLRADLFRLPVAQLA
jgi:hypothetical protein